MENNRLRALAIRMDALNGSFSIHLDIHGQWYATMSAEVKHGGILEGVAFHADTLDEAIEGLWNELSTLPPDVYIVINATSETRRRHYRWEPLAAMWKEIPR